MALEARSPARVPPFTNHAGRGLKVRLFQHVRRSVARYLASSRLIHGARGTPTRLWTGWATYDFIRREPPRMTAHSTRNT